MGPSLAGIGKRETLDQIVKLVEEPAGTIMPKLYPATLSAAQVNDVAAYITKTF